VSLAVLISIQIFSIISGNFSHSICLGLILRKNVLSGIECKPPEIKNPRGKKEKGK